MGTMACTTDSVPNFSAFPDSGLKSSCDFLPPDSGFGDQNGNVSLPDHEANNRQEVSVNNDSGAASTFTSVTLPDSIDSLSNTERLLLMQEILDMFFNNKIKEAENAVEPFKDKCKHFAHAKSVFTSISSFLTLDPVSIGIYACTVH